MIDNACVVFPAPLVALTVKLNVPTVVGVPEISPVEVFKVRPSGRLPESIDHVKAAEPVAARVWLYDAPTVPLFSAVVVIVGGPSRRTTPSELVEGVTVVPDKMLAGLAVITVDPPTPFATGKELPAAPPLCT